MLLNTSNRPTESPLDFFFPFFLIFVTMALMAVAFYCHQQRISIVVTRPTAAPPQAQAQPEIEILPAEKGGNITLWRNILVGLAKSDRGRIMVAEISRHERYMRDRAIEKIILRECRESFADLATWFPARSHFKNEEDYNQVLGYWVGLQIADPFVAVAYKAKYLRLPLTTRADHLRLQMMTNNQKYVDAGFSHPDSLRNMLSSRLTYPTL